MSADLLDLAVRQALADPQRARVLAQDYKTADTVNDARRFNESEEFKATLNLLNRVGHGPNANQKLIDVGAGNGIASFAFARSGYQVTAIEPSASEIAGFPAAKKLCRADGVTFDILQSRLDQLDDKMLFSVVYLREVLHHAADLKDMVGQLARRLAPNGVILCMREIVIWSETQRDRFLASHPLHSTSNDEGAFYLDEYRKAFQLARLKILCEVGPTASIINLYPQTMEGLRAKMRLNYRKRFPPFLEWVLDTNKGDEWARWWYAFFQRSHSHQLYSFVLKDGR